MLQRVQSNEKIMNSDEQLLMYRDTQHTAVHDVIPSQKQIFDLSSVIHYVFNGRQETGLTQQEEQIV